MSTSQGNLESPRGVLNAVDQPDHLLVLVHGIMGRAEEPIGKKVLDSWYIVCAVDIKGARQAGQPWFSILTRTGVFKEDKNHTVYPADLVVDTVEEAVDYILRKESL